MTKLQKAMGIGAGLMLVIIPLLASAHTGSLNGATSVTVAPGAPITFASLVNLDAGDSVDAILYSTDGSTFTCADTNDVENTTHHHISGAGTVSFTFAAPTTPGTYNFTYKVADGDLCDSNIGSLQTDPALTITVSGPTQYTLTVTDVGPGVTTPGTGLYNSGDIVTLVPTPAANANFVGFSQDCSGAFCPLSIDGNTNVTATYQCNVGFHVDGATCQPDSAPSCPAGAYTDATDYSGSMNFEPSAYALGSISGQNGWSNAVNPAYDQAVVANTYGYPTFGAQSFRISDAVTSGSFGDWVFAAPTANAAGEADSTDGSFTPGTLQNHFETQFNIASTMPCQQQPGLHVSVSPDRGDGSRLSYLRFEDGVAGIDVFFDDVQGTSNPANFVETQIATGLDRTVPHTVKMTIDFVDGPSNDVVKVWIDGALVHTGTSWENYYRYDTESSAEQSTRIVKTVIIQARGTATPADLGKGFLFDNLTVSTGAPSDDSSTGGSSVTSNNPQCSDGIDNDNDGRVDYPADGSCSDASDNSEGNDGGAFFGTFGGNTGGNGNAPGGLVLGASTDVPACSNPLITSFMKMGGKNDSDQVKKLQDFLNTNISAGLTVNGIFDSATMQAVKAFQLKYWQDVLAPWKPWGLGDHDATGYVYKTTQRMINLLSCSNLILPLPQLP